MCVLKRSIPYMVNNYTNNFILIFATLIFYNFVNLIRTPLCNYMLIHYYIEPTVLLELAVTLYEVKKVQYIKLMRSIVYIDEVYEVKRKLMSINDVPS